MSFWVLPVTVNLNGLTTGTMKVDCNHERTLKAGIIHLIQLIGCITLFCNLVIPVMLVFIISWWMPLFIDRYVFFSSLSIPPLLAVLLTRAKKRFVASGLSYSPYYSAMVHIIITLST